MSITTGKVREQKSLKANGPFFAQTDYKKQPFFQPKLTVGPVDDVYEKEADEVASKVMSMSSPDTSTVQPKITPLPIQRMCSDCEEKERAQRKEKGKPGVMSEALSIVNKAVQSGCCYQ